jgi:Zc3h12a-like Ribonuclease NYN domain
MARPRLVEEGVPIGSTLGIYGDREDDDDDQEMMELEDRHHHVDKNRVALQHDEDVAARRPPLDSSLMRAVGGEIHIQPKRPRPTNRTVIGGGTATSAEEVDHYYKPPSSSSPSPASSSAHHHSSYHHTNSWTHRDDRPSAPSPPPPCSAAIIYHPTKKRIEIGQEQEDVARMEGVEDLSLKQPLVVLDGANVAYGYNLTEKGPPNIRGILVAVQYWLQHHIRVLVVLPQPWFHNDHDMAQLLAVLPSPSLLVAAPSRDDDDAYALQIAMRENARALARSRTSGRLEGLAYVISNDMFRDAQVRDSSGRLTEWLNNTEEGSLGKGRISYTFANMGRLDDHGDVELDYLPNPRHPLVAWAEQQQQLQPR